MSIKCDYKLPKSLECLLQGQEFSVDDVGLSGSTVWVFEDKVLKIRNATEETETEHAMLLWLEGRLPVPTVIFHEVTGGVDYLLMSKVNGDMACDQKLMSDPVQLTQVLADSLKQIWSIDISDCPVSGNLDRKLFAATAAVKNCEVDTDNAEPGTFGDNGFRDPAELLTWLMSERQEEDLVLSHGDFCLPNIFIKSGKLSGIIDLGRSGVADKWQDIALCYRSLKHNYAGKYGAKAYEDYDPELLFTALGMEPDWRKLNYYILLDELF